MPNRRVTKIEVSHMNGQERTCPGAAEPVGWPGVVRILDGGLLGACAREGDRLCASGVAGNGGVRSRRARMSVLLRAVSDSLA